MEAAKTAFSLLFVSTYLGPGVKGKYQSWIKEVSRVTHTIVSPVRCHPREENFYYHYLIYCLIDIRSYRRILVLSGFDSLWACDLWFNDLHGYLDSNELNELLNLNQFVHSSELFVLNGSSANDPFLQVSDKLFDEFILNNCLGSTPRIKVLRE